MVFCSYTREGNYLVTPNPGVVNRQTGVRLHTQQSMPLDLTKYLKKITADRNWSTYVIIRLGSDSNAKKPLCSKSSRVAYPNFLK